MFGHQFKAAASHPTGGVQVLDGQLRAVAPLYAKVGVEPFELPDKADAHCGRFARQDQDDRQDHADNDYGGHGGHGDMTGMPRGAARLGAPVRATLVGQDMPLVRSTPLVRGIPLGSGVVVWLRHVTSRYGADASESYSGQG